MIFIIIDTKGANCYYQELSGLSSNAMISLEVVKALSEYGEYTWPAFYWVDHYSEIGSPYANLFENSDSGKYLTSSEAIYADEAIYVRFSIDTSYRDYKTDTDKYIRAVHNFIND